MPLKRTFEVDEPIVTVLPKPKILTRPHLAKYWICFGEFRSEPWWKRLWAKPVDESTVWSLAFYDADSAEAHAASDHDGFPWVWNGEPASQTDLRELMANARVSGRKGVRIVEYSEGAWQIVHEYPADQPLPKI